MNVLNVHRFWQDSCQKYGAKGMFKVRLTHSNARLLLRRRPALALASAASPADASLPAGPALGCLPCRCGCCI